MSNGMVIRHNSFSEPKCVPGTVLESCVMNSFNPLTTSRSRCSYESKAQRGWESCLRLHSKARVAAEPSGYSIHAFCRHTVSPS